MPGPLTTHQREAFLAEPHVAVLSVAGGNGGPPHASPIWYAYQPGGNLTFFTGKQGRTSRKSALVEAAGVVSLTVQREEFPYRHVTVQGTVVRADRPPSAEQVLTIARRYMPEEQAQGFVAAELGRPGDQFVLFTIRPDRWLTFDFSEEAG